MNRLENGSGIDKIPPNVPPPPKPLLIRRNSLVTKHPLSYSTSNSHVNPSTGIMITPATSQPAGQPTPQHQQQQNLTKPDLFNFNSNPMPAVIDDNISKHQQCPAMVNSNVINKTLDTSNNCQSKLAYPLIFCDDHQLYDKENSFYLYHHEPAAYLPNYDNITKTKYNTMECTIGINDSVAGGQQIPLQQFNVPSSKMHASSCNLNNQFNSSNLINGHHFSNSLNNFHHMMDPTHAQIPNYYNYNPSFTQLPPDAIHRGGIVGGGVGGMMPGAFGSSSIIGSSFASNISLNGTPKQQQGNVTWKHRNGSSRSSSSGTNSSSKFGLEFLREIHNLSSLRCCFLLLLYEWLRLLLLLSITLR